MSQENKFDFNVTQQGEQWNAEITRRISARKTTVSKRKKGFESEEQATVWAKEQLADFLDNLQASNKRKAEKRVERNELLAKGEAEKEAKAIAYQEKRLAAMEAMDAEDELEKE